MCGKIENPAWMDDTSAELTLEDRKQDVYCGFAHGNSVKITNEDMIALYEINVFGVHVLFYPGKAYSCFILLQNINR